MNKPDINCFIYEVDVFNDNSKGHYERRNKALQSYLRYPCYEGWGIAGKDILNVKDNYRLGGDVLTSIKTPINNSLEGMGNAKLTGYGWDIKRLFDNQTDENNETRKKLQDLMPYFRAFSIVYYWIGNMIPVARNFSAQWRDTWKFKLDCIEKWWRGENGVSGKAEYEKTFMDWIGYLKRKGVEDYGKFISYNYLQDMVDSENHTKPVFIESSYYMWDQLKKTDNTDIIMEWFINNSKIIIQRSYRILFDFKDSWENSSYDRDYVITIMDHVFEEAGFLNHEKMLNLF